MSSTRRDVLKLASALGLAGTVPSSAERVAAMRVLDQEVSPKQVLDPIAFAQAADGALGGALDDDWLLAICPVEHAAFVQAHKALQAAVTMLDTPEGRRVFGDYDGAFFNFVMASYTAGIRHGAAYENLRRSVVGELVLCEECWGVGATRDRDVCASCGGTGTIALRA